MISNEPTNSTIKFALFSSFPTTILRSVCLKGCIEINHSVNSWLYERWRSYDITDTEIAVLHKEMKEILFHYSNNKKLEVTFVHLSPRTIQKNKKEYLSCQQQ